jgi:hypothetical protein
VIGEREIAADVRHRQCLGPLAPEEPPGQEESGHHTSAEDVHSHFGTTSLIANGRVHRNRPTVIELQIQRQGVPRPQRLCETEDHQV